MTSSYAPYKFLSSYYKRRLHQIRPFFVLSLLPDNNYLRAVVGDGRKDDIKCNKSERSTATTLTTQQQQDPDLSSMLFSLPPREPSDSTTVDNDDDTPFEKDQQRRQRRLIRSIHVALRCCAFALPPCLRKNDDRHKEIDALLQSVCPVLEEMLRRKYFILSSDKITGEVYKVFAESLYLKGDRYHIDDIKEKCQLLYERYVNELFEDDVIAPVDDETISFPGGGGGTTTATMSNVDDSFYEKDSEDEFHEMLHYILLFMCFIFELACEFSFSTIQYHHFDDLDKDNNNNSNNNNINEGNKGNVVGMPDNSSAARFSPVKDLYDGLYEGLFHWCPFANGDLPCDPKELFAITQTDSKRSFYELISLRGKQHKRSSINLDGPRWGELGWLLTAFCYLYGAESEFLMAPHLLFMPFVPFLHDEKLDLHLLPFYLNFYHGNGIDNDKEKDEDKRKIAWIMPFVIIHPTPKISSVEQYFSVLNEEEMKEAITVNRIDPVGKKSVSRNDVTDLVSLLKAFVDALE